MANTTNPCCVGRCFTDICEHPLKWTLGTVATVAAVVAALAVATLLIPALTALVGLSALSLYITLGISGTLAVLAAAGAVFFACGEASSPHVHRPSSDVRDLTFRPEINGEQYNFVSLGVVERLLSYDQRFLGAAQCRQIAQVLKPERVLNISSVSALKNMFPSNIEYVFCEPSRGVWTQEDFKDVIAVAKMIAKGHAVLVVAQELSDYATFMVVGELVKYAVRHRHENVMLELDRIIAAVEVTMHVYVSDASKNCINSYEFELRRVNDIS